MCFEMYYAVDRVEAPDAVESFDVFRVPNVTMTDVEARNTLAAAIRMYLDGQVVKAVLAEAAKFDKNEALVYGDPLPEVPERSVVFTTPLGHRYLDAGDPELLFITHNMLMDHKIIVLQFKDFSFVVMYSVEYTSTEKSYMHADVRIKFGIEAESVTVYNCEARPLADS